MAFNSIQYFVFLPIVFLLYWLCPSKIKKYVLLAASYFFYMSWSYKYLGLIVFSTVLSWSTSLAIDRSDKRGKKEKAFLAAGVILNLFVLFFFKYFNFVSQSIHKVGELMNISSGQAVTVSVLLPVGISFYTFQSLSYVIDVYRKKYKAEKNVVNYALYISFFPQLVAGPIERASNILPQLRKEKAFDYNQAVDGSKSVLFGLIKKICIADVLAVYVNSVYNNISGQQGPMILVATLFFTFQIYCDFSAYSEIAIGSAKLFGIELMNNFNCPYFSSSVREFWSRWHISLSQWFRDYLYIPLGGNRCSKVRNYFNLLITFLVSGLWHGSNWTFVIWGGLHGIAQITEKAFFLKSKNKIDNRFKKVVRIFLTFVFVSFTWIFFRANSITEAISAIKLLFTGWNIANVYSCITSIGKTNLIIIAIGMMLLTTNDYLLYKGKKLFDIIGKKRAVLRWIIYFMLVIYVSALFIYFNGGFGTAQQFIYFQF